MLGIVVSFADEASVHIGNQLRDIAEWETNNDHTRQPEEGGGTYYELDGAELREFDGLHLQLTDAADAFSDPRLLVFVSRHAGDTGPLLTTHFTGNAGTAEYGGENGQLSLAAPKAQTAVLEALSRYAPAGYTVGMECTHHGPSQVGVPSLFVEVGSEAAQWNDPAGARAVARAVLDLREVKPTQERTVVGFGGGHYVPRFERIVRETDWAVGHVLAEWGIEALADLSRESQRTVVKQVFGRSGASRAVMDGEYPTVADMIADCGYQIVSETWVRETTGIALDLVTRLEDQLRPIDHGLRFGEIAPTWDGESYRIYEPDPDLLMDTSGINRVATQQAVAEHALAYETEDNGNRIAGRIAILHDHIATLVDDLVEILESRFEAIERRNDELIVTEQSFDPDAARELGVPEGPAFGTLSEGDPIEVDGKTITPEMVHARRTRQYDI